jgi:hypothetical protein
MQSSIIYLDLPRGLSAEFPAPPRVHWLVLLLALIAVGILVAIFVPRPSQSLAESLVDSVWPVYFCVWLRELSPDSNSFFWCDAFVVVQLANAAMAMARHTSDTTQALTGLLGLASAVLGIATIFIIRKELLRHYNEREPYGLYLGGVMTFFFSFLYFQSQLYPIAVAKNETAMRGETMGGRTIA